MPLGLTRRDWVLASLGSAAWAAVASAQEHANHAAESQAPPRFGFFSPAEAAEISALTGQILPSDDGPGAREAGVIYFIDRALTTFDAGLQRDYREGLVALEDTRKKLFPDSASLAALPQTQQLEVVRAIEKTDFFETVRTHTLLGFLGLPSYGGNRGRVGWKHIGFENRMGWQPPFGYYDAEAK